MALVTQGPSDTLDSALQPLGLLGVVLGSKRAVSAPGGEDMWTGSGRSIGKEGGPTSPFPKQVPPSWTPPPSLLVSRKRPMQSLSQRTEAGITLAALRDEPVASRAQQGLPRIPGPGQVPATHPAPLFLPGNQPCLSRSPSLLPQPLAQTSRHAPNQPLSNFPDARLARSAVGGGVRRPGCEFRDRTYRLCNLGQVLLPL